MDDGCSKRFDIGTVDIRETYELAAPNRSFSGPYGHILPPPTTLPPLPNLAQSALPSDAARLVAIWCTRMQMCGWGIWDQGMGVSTLFIYRSRLSDKPFQCQPTPLPT